MTPLSFLYITLSISIIIIAVAIVVATIVLVVILWEIRRIVGSIRMAMRDVKIVGDMIKNDFVARLLEYGRRIFQKKGYRKKTH